MKKCAIMKPGVVIKDASLDTRDQHVKQVYNVKDSLIRTIQEKKMCYVFIVGSAATCVLDIDRHWRRQYPITILLSYMFSRQKSFLFIFYI